MAAKLLTPRTVETAGPKHNAAGKLVCTEYPDAACPGLYLVVQSTGTRSWALRYRRPDRKTAKLTLGSASKDGLTLAAARHAAAAARHRLEQGEDPASRRQVKLAAPTYRYEIGDSVAAWAGSFLELHARRKNRDSTARAAERIFNRLVLPAWRGRSIHSIRRRDVIDLVEQIATDRPYLANRTLGVLSKFFNWLCARDVLAVSPAAGVERPHREEVRNRTLSDAELRALWLACEGDGPFGQALRLLILCGARRNEISRLSWVEIDEERRVWVLPRARSKNGRPHAIPLSSQAWAIIRNMPRFADCDYVFTADGCAPVIGWAKAKSRISLKAGIAEESWRLHDLRRSVAAGMARLGTSVPVIEKALNHQSGVFRGIVSTYQTHDYADEIHIALQRWGDHVEQIVGGRPAKVIKLREQR
jgi:integrase